MPHRRPGVRGHGAPGGRDLVGQLRAVDRGGCRPTDHGRLVVLADRVVRGDDDRAALPRGEELVGPGRVPQPRVREVAEDLGVHVAAQVPRLDLGPGHRVDRCPRLGIRAGHEERETQPIAVRGQPGVHALGVGVQGEARGGSGRGKIPFRGVAPAERPDDTIGLQRALAEEFREPTGRDVPPDLHLPHPLLRMDVALSEEQIMGIGRGDVDEAVDVACHGHLGMEAGHRQVAARLRQRPGRDPREPAHAGQQAQHDDGDRAHHDDPDDAHEALRSSLSSLVCRAASEAAQRSSRTPRPLASARRTMASAKTTSARPTPRWVTTTRPAGGRGVSARIASPSVATGSG